MSDGTPAPPRPSILEIFSAFLLIGATSFGGGVVAYLRSGLVAKHEWLDDKTFVELLSISQTMPGLNATNMAILVGDRLRGALGAIAAIVGICLPGGLFMFVAGLLYGYHKDVSGAAEALKGVAAAAVGLVLATTVQISGKSLKGIVDLLFVAATAVCVAVFHWSVLYVLLGAGFLAILWYRPRGAAKAEEAAP
jgi:chromate transporter